MKTFKDKKGFTLIELLAVIVVLAIVMVLAMTTVLPYAARARKNAFMTEVNAAIQAAGNEMSMIAIDTHRHGVAPLLDSTNKDYKRISVTTGGYKYCFTLKKLVDLGWLTKSKEAVDPTNGTYAGYVVVTSTPNSNVYTYSVKMHNTQYQADAAKGEVTESDINDYNGDTDTWDCSAVS